MAVYKRTWTNKRGVQHAWVADYFSKDPETGKLVRERPTFATKADAQAHWMEHHPRGSRGRANAKTRRITIKKAADIWHEAVKVGRSGRDPAEPSTLRQYRGHIDLHIVPFFGDEKLSDLTAPRVAEFRDHLLANLSRPLAKKVLVSFKSLLRECEARGLIAANPASAISIAGTGNGRHEEQVSVPEKSEIKAILAKLDELASQENQQRAKAWRRWRVLVNTAALTGMRASELRGLAWSQVELKKATISVTQRADESGQIGPPKSASGRRAIDIPPSLVSMLRKWKVDCPAGEHDLVFPNWQGNVESLANVHNRCWRPLLTAAKVMDDEGRPRFSLHALRHFRASLLIDDGANAKEVQAELGHSSPTITLTLYSHLFKDDEAGAVRKARAKRLASTLGVT